jgi:hypothetical protein
VAILAIALQAIFAGFAGGPAIAAPLDPATIICHSDPAENDADRQTPSAQHDCCTQCVLCSTLSVATAPCTFVLFVPSRQQTAAFIPFSAVEPTPIGGLTTHPPRGPPRGV